MVPPLNPLTVRVYGNTWICLTFKFINKITTCKKTLHSALFWCIPVFSIIIFVEFALKLKKIYRLVECRLSLNCLWFLFDYDKVHKTCKCDQSAYGVRSFIMMAPDPTYCKGQCLLCSCLVLSLSTFDFQQCSLSLHFIYYLRYVWFTLKEST